MFRRGRAALAIIFLAVTSACSGGSGSSPLPVSTPIPTVVQHLYAVAHGSGTNLAVYTLPLTTSSTPSLKIVLASGGKGVLVDAPNNRLFVGEPNSVAVYSLPLTGSSVPAFSIPIPGSDNGQMALDGSGNLYVADQNGEVRVFASPLSAASTATVTKAFAGPSGVAIDATHLYVAENGSSTVYAFALPFTAASTPVATLTTANGFTYVHTLAVASSGQLIVASNNGVDFFNTPVTNASAVAFGITNGAPSPLSVAFDATGNLYVVNFAFGSGMLSVYTPPSTLALTGLNLSTGVGYAPDSIAIGP